MNRISPLTITKRDLSYNVTALSYKKTNRLDNQDAFSINEVIINQKFESIQIKKRIKNYTYLAISDGVSNSQNGGKAAKQSVTLFSKGYSFEGINEQLLSDFNGQCTLTTLTLYYDLAISQSIGDSMIILVRNKKIHYLSFKQNYTTRINFLTKQKINSNILEHYLSNHKFEILNTNLNTFKVYPGDIIYLLTDGYQQIISPQHFKKLLKNNKLIDYLQNYQGQFNDDTTIIKVEIREGEL